MSERFVRCPHCRLPHDVQTTLCPVTNKPIVVERKSEGRRLVAGGAPPVRTEPEPKPARPKVEEPIPLAKPALPSSRAPAIVPTKTPAAAARGRYGGADARGLLGRTLDGKYKIKGVLGEGGMGTVYEGSHVALGRAVAIKVLHPNQARKPEAVQRLYQEARSAGSIGHPNICEVYDVGRFDDQSPFLVMERLEGETLAERISSEGALPFEFVVDVMSQVLSGLIAAHAKGIVHRDIKPENIFLTRRAGLPPIAKILDFGVSKVLQTEEQEQGLELTRTGMVMGTPYYLSPEQARGDRSLDHRVDIWACGIMLYECLAGRRPFIAPNYNALLVQILQTSPRPIREIRPATPAGFDVVLRRALERERENRYRSGSDMQSDLQLLRDRHRPSVSSIPIVSPATMTRVEAPPRFVDVATPPSGEQAPVLNLSKLAEEDTKVLLDLRSSSRVPAARLVTMADEDLEELDIDIELESEIPGSPRRTRPSVTSVSRPPHAGGAEDTLYGMNIPGAGGSQAPPVQRSEADEERTQVMVPRPQKPPTDPEATVRIERKR